MEKAHTATELDGLKRRAEVNAKYNVDLNLLRPRRVAGMAPCLGVVAGSADAAPATCSTTIGRGNDGGDRPRRDDLLLEINVHMMGMINVLAN